MHLSTSFWNKTHADNDLSEEQKLCGGMLSSGYLPPFKFVEFYSAVSEKSKMSQPIRGLGGYLGFPFGQKNTNL